MIAFPFDVPVDPDQPTARQLLLEELAKQEYQQAKPTLWDQLVGNFFSWLGSLSGRGVPGAPPAFSLLAIVIIIVVVLVIAFLVFGLPRINRRSKVTGSLFGEDDARTAAQMRSAGEAAAATGDFETAIAEMFRSIARGLAERTVLTTSPGTTAHNFATRASECFPVQAEDLTAASLAFDEVRYLGREGSAQQYELVRELERRLRATKPAALEAVGS